MDTREAILARLRTLIETIPGLAMGSNGAVRGVGRNRDDVSGAVRPAIILNDGGEENLDSDNPPARTAVQMMRMEPELVILVGTPTEDVGSVANIFRARLIVAVLNDSELGNLIGPGGPRGRGGDIHYLGSEFESQAGERREGRMTVNFGITYVLRVADLALTTTMQHEEV
jgi:hypothetical protein